MILIVGGLASGKATYASSLGFDGDEMALNVHQTLAPEADVAAYVEELCKKKVVTCADVGSGVVPLDAEERAWREGVGSLTMQLAQRADKVIRMVCGIPVTIKDDAGEVPCS